MNRLLKNLILIACLAFGPSLSIYAQHSREDVVAIGFVTVVAGQNGRTVILDDEYYGEVELLLTPGLVQTVDEYPAESFEAEGTLTNGQMIVKSLRPIE